MSEIYGTAPIDLKFKIRSIGDVVATVRGRSCVVSAMGFEHKTIGDDPRLLAKAIDFYSSERPVNTPDADPETQAWIDAVNWPVWPRAETALGG